MRSLPISVVVFFVIALWFLAPIGHEAYAENTNTRSKEAGPRLTEAEAVEIATKVAVKKRIDLKNYEMLNCRYLTKDKSWYVSFNGKQRIVGDHFSVVVYDRNRTTRFVPGQ
jgi:hypothetical protein